MPKWVQFFLIIVFAMAIGYGAATTSFKKDTAENFMKGTVSFCQLNEAERIRICPMVRTQENGENDARLIMYQCNGTYAFVVMEKPTKKMKEMLMVKFLKLSTNGVRIASICQEHHKEAFFLIATGATEI